MCVIMNVYFKKSSKMIQDLRQQSYLGIFPFQVIVESQS